MFQLSIHYWFSSAVALSVLLLSVPTFGAEEATTIIERRPKRSTKEALTVYASAAALQYKNKFGPAIDEWSKFVKKHKDDPRAIEALYNLAICQMMERRIEETIGNLTRVVASAGEDFERLEDAILNLGWSQYCLGLKKKEDKHFLSASKTFATFLAKFPKSEHRHQAFFFSGDSAYRLGKTNKAAKLFDELMLRHPTSPLVKEAKKRRSELGPIRRISN